MGKEEIMYIERIFVKRSFGLMFMLLFCSTGLTVLAMEQVKLGESVVHAIKEKWINLEDRIAQLMHDVKVPTDFQFGATIARIDPIERTVKTYLNKTWAIELSYERFLALFAKTESKGDDEDQTLQILIDGPSIDALESEGLRNAFFEHIAQMTSALAKQKLLKNSLAEKLMKDPNALQSYVREFIEKNKLRCTTCMAPNSTKRCPCYKVRYCSVDCQRTDWMRHKKECTYEKK